MNISKYKYKYRVLLLYTNNYINKDYKKIKELYEKNIKEFHKRNIKLISNLNKDNSVEINLFGLDGKLKFKAKNLNVKKIFKLVDNMPLEKVKNKLSLYSDYNPKTTIPGLGFKDKEKAIYTVNKIKSKSITYQKSVLNTMINRAKFHPHKNKNMEDAIKIFKKRLIEIKNNNK